MTSHIYSKRISPRFVDGPSSTPSASAPADQPTDATAETSNIIYKDGAAPNHRGHIRPDAPAAAADLACKPKPAATASSASVLTDSNAGDSYHDSDRLAASDRPLSSVGQDCGHLPQQHGCRADGGPALPASAQSGVAGTGIRHAGAVGDVAGGGPESAGSRLEASETKHAAKQRCQPQQQQQSPPSSSTICAAVDDTSPHKHIGQLFFCHQLLCG